MKKEYTYEQLPLRLIGFFLAVGQHGGQLLQMKRNSQLKHLEMNVNVMQQLKKAANYKNSNLMWTASGCTDKRIPVNIS